LGGENCCLTSGFRSRAWRSLPSLKTLPASDPGVMLSTDQPFNRSAAFPIATKTMKTHADRIENKSVANQASHKQTHSSGATFQFVDNRPETKRLQKLQEMMNNSSQVHQLSAVRQKSEPSQSGVIQRLTIGYTSADLGYPPPAAPAFGAAVVQQIVYQRAGIPQAVKDAVDGFGDCPAAGTYHHHVGHNMMVDRIKNLCEGQSRKDIVDELEIRMDLLGISFKDQRPVDPMDNVAAFNTWLDNAIVRICDWPRNIFRGAKDNGEPDNPTAPSPALTARLNEARRILQDIDML
jgi:hypothetical protein